VPEAASTDRKVLFLGVKQAGAAALSTLLEEAVEVTAAITMPGDENEQIASLAAAAGIECLVDPKLRSRSVRREILGHGSPDIALCFSYPRILKRPFLGEIPEGCINFHPARLPAYRGCYPTVWPILRGDGEGVYTAHKMDEGIDTGPIVATRAVSIDADETGWSLYLKLIAELPAFVRSLIPMVRSREIATMPQNDAAAEYFDAGALEPLAALDWTRSAGEIGRAVRALYHPIFKGATAPLCGRTVEIRSCEAVIDAPVGSPGSAQPGDSGVIVACGEGGLLLREIRLEDGRCVSSSRELSALASQEA